MGQLVPIKIPPGMFRNGTAYEASGRWFQGNLVRWENGRLKPIGGWQATVPVITLTGMARGGITFTDDHGFYYMIIGTNLKLYIGQSGSLTDSTPPGLVTGRADSILGAGYGAGPYGASTYGTARTTNTLQLAAATWQMDTFGNLAVMVLNSDRNIYQFDPGTGLVTNLTTGGSPDHAPTGVGVFATNEDFLVVIGASGVGRRVAWADVGATSIWVPTDLNSAGDINLQTAGTALAGTRVGLQNLIWTTTDVHLFNFVGQPAIYAPVRIGTACGLVGPRAWAVAASGASAGEAAYWMSNGGFFQYNGVVTPLPCEVQDYLWQNINWTQAAKIYASTNSLFHEIIWFYPSVNSMEIDSYVIYNYKDNIWYYGIMPNTFARTTYLDRGSFPRPIGVDPGGIVYEHEFGYLANRVSRVGQVFAISAPFEIGNGDQVIYSNMMLIDGDGLINSLGPVLNMTPLSRQNPLGAVTPLNPNVPGQTIPMVLNAEGYTPVRFSGRQIALRFDAMQDTLWELGKLRFDVVGGSKR
jgi:hypothetical protein